MCLARDIILPWPLILSLGQTLLGRSGSYTIQEQLQNRTWMPQQGSSLHLLRTIRLPYIWYRSSTLQEASVRTTPDLPLKNESQILEAVGASSCIQLILDASNDPPSLVLKHTDDNLLKALNAKKRAKTEIKFVNQNILQPFRTPT